jgi:hypothetical protein
MDSGSVDAFRQTAIVLGADVELVLQGLNAEGALAAASSSAPFRTQMLAGAMGLWSRGWLARLEALRAIQWGNYVAAMVLTRAATDYLASQILHLESRGAEWEAWIAQGGVGRADDVHATEFRLHAFRAGEVLASHITLGRLYRIVTDFSLPHFGATLLAAGSDSDGERVAITFGDRDFHFALAELTLGWLLTLHAAQADAVVTHPSVFADATALVATAAAANAHLAGAHRCTVDIIERDEEERYLVRNWRRTAGSAAKRVLL